MRLNKAIIALLAMVMVPLLGILALTGCSSSVLPETLEAKLASSPTVEDHLAAAMLYEKKARELDAEAVKYEAAASKIDPSEDPKGFQRGALAMAAQQKRQEAKEMQRLYALHFRQSNVLQGKVEPE